jgi:alkylation response protein AidB-like acyl-CoA dehydrogenase
MTSSVSDLTSVRAHMRKLAETWSADYWRARDRERSFPQEFFEAVGRAGYFGALIDEEHGGAAAGLGAASLLVEEINRAGGDAAAVNAQMTICGVIAREGSPAQRQLLRQVANGELRMLSVAATEPDSGAEMANLSSRAVREGTHWRIDAQKVLISMAEHTEVLLLLAQAEAGPTLFLVDLRDPEQRGAVEVRPIDLMVNRMTTTVFVDQLRLPDSARIGAVGKGLGCLMKGFATRRIMAAAECIGNARFLLERAVEHAKVRKVGGTPLGAHQAVSHPLARAYSKVEAADLMRWDAIRQVEAGEDADGRSALAKLLASEAAWEAAQASLACFGGWGLAAEYHVERKLRESSVFVFNNLLYGAVATRVLGLPREGTSESRESGAPAEVAK